MIDTGEGIPKWASLIANVLEKDRLSITSVLITHFHLDREFKSPKSISPNQVD